MNDIYNVKAEIAAAAAELVKICTERGVKVSTAESCTGGLISAAVTSVSGSSAVIELGVCSYSNKIKNEVLGVSGETLERFSEYSRECAEEMAAGAMRLSGADFAVSTTGVAGPSGGTPEHPVGEVFIGICSRNSHAAKRFLFTGDRETVRAMAVLEALKMLILTIDTTYNHNGG